ncbi:MAG: hypothetical protein OXT67_07455 [Zetaproteobacteria bacterium]|nr:hypothetical protein [Zetaproteobacteria bacterium]
MKILSLRHKQRVKGAVAVEYLVVSVVSLALSFAMISFALHLLSEKLVVLGDTLGVPLSVDLLKKWIHSGF